MIGSLKLLFLKQCENVILYDAIYHYSKDGKCKQATDPQAVLWIRISSSTKEGDEKYSTDTVF